MAVFSWPPLKHTRLQSFKKQKINISLLRYSQTCSEDGLDSEKGSICMLRAFAGLAEANHTLWMESKLLLFSALFCPSINLEMSPSELSRETAV